MNSPEEFVARLSAMDQAIAPADGLRWFNRMYGIVTSAVSANLGANAFADPVWMSHLDVVFANLYLDAVRASVLNPGSEPRAWAPLVESRTQPGILPLQFAFAGMNAHINRDLAVAVVTACKDLQSSPSAGSHHSDFETMNTVLAQVEPTIRQIVEGELLSDADKLIPGLQDMVANFDMVKARETAWTNAETLWTLGQIAPAQAAAYLDGLDRLTGFAGRGLLVHLAPLL